MHGDIAEMKNTMVRKTDVKEIVNSIVSELKNEIKSEILTEAKATIMPKLTQSVTDKKTPEFYDKIDSKTKDFNIKQKKYPTAFNLNLKLCEKNFLHRQKSLESLN